MPCMLRTLLETEPHDDGANRFDLRGSNWGGLEQARATFQLRRGLLMDWARVFPLRAVHRSMDRVCVFFFLFFSSVCCRAFRTCPARRAEGKGGSIVPKGESFSLLQAWVRLLCLGTRLADASGFCARRSRSNANLVCAV